MTPVTHVTRSSRLHLIYRVEHQENCPVAERWSANVREEILGSRDHPYHGPSFRDLREFREKLDSNPSYATCKRIPFGSRGPVPGCDHFLDNTYKPVIMEPEWWTGFELSQAGSWWDPHFVTDATDADWQRLDADGWRVGVYTVWSEHVQRLTEQVLFRPMFARAVETLPMRAVSSAEPSVDVLIHEELEDWLKGAQAA